ncbi:TSUP family transporter [Cohnella terricola]|uniref:Probable membrane transporter protein n=1 Tax=Cohnella terricola TaxID=1289167 RepID=A0A559JKI3_9BACL|nr:TSUP family transporter [Cohnella terricola]TVY00388.1 TSUP family transporter [Cohnella terricola]
MDELNLGMLLFLIVAGYIAAFIDSVVGGGGLISLPALLLSGLPPSVALGTNKLAGTMSSLTSSISFMASGKIDVQLVKKLFPLALVGSAAGAYTVAFIPSSFLKPLVVVMLIAVTVYTAFKKNWGDRSTYRGLTKNAAIATAAIAAVIGYYDGFFGPGTGSFLIFAFLLLGFDFVLAAGNAKALNFASNIGSLLMFIALGKVNYVYGLPMGLAMVAGALTGSRLAIRKGSAYVKPLFFLVTALLIGKQIWDLLG